MQVMSSITATVESDHVRISAWEKKAYTGTLMVTRDSAAEVVWRLMDKPEWSETLTTVTIDTVAKSCQAFARQLADRLLLNLKREGVPTIEAISSIQVLFDEVKESIAVAGAVHG